MYHKRQLSWLLLVVFILSSVLVMSPVTAQEDEGVVAAPAGEAVTVRSGPGLQYSIRGVLEPGFDLVVTGRTAFDEDFACTGEPENDLVAWLRVDVVEGIEGWVSYCAVAVTGEVAPLPVAVPAYPVLLEDIEDLETLVAEGWDPADPFMASVLATPVLLYEYPSLGSAILGIIDADAVVELLARADDGSWFQVQFGEVVGWVPGYLLLVGNDQYDELEVVNLEAFFDALIDEEIGDGEGCQNPPPPWAPAWGWRRKCEGVEKGEYEPAPPPGQVDKMDDGETVE